MKKMQLDLMPGAKTGGKAAGTRRKFDLRQDLWRVAGILGALLLLNIGFYIFLNMPRLQALSDLANGRDEVRRTLADINKSCETMRGLVSRYDDETARLTKFYDERIGTQVERMTRIQEVLGKIATEFRISPESMDYTTTNVEGTRLVRFQVTMPLLGGYPNLRHFVQRVETAPYLVVIDSIELAGSREGGAMLNLTIRLSTYFEGADDPRLANPAAPPKKGAPA